MQQMLIKSTKACLQSAENVFSYQKHILQTYIDIIENVKQIIFASTEWVYGEDKSGQKNESSHIYFENLGSEYALSKAICENILKYYCLLNNINCTILRFGITYGPRQNKDNWSAVESILYDLFLGNTKITIGSKKTARKFI